MFMCLQLLHLLHNGSDRCELRGSSFRHVLLLLQRVCDCEEVQGLQLPGQHQRGLV